MKSADLIKELKAAGWKLDRVRGSHHQFKHPTIGLTITVPHPKKDLGRGWWRRSGRMLACRGLARICRVFNGVSHALSHRN
ncbi:MAG: type II toxin-antitoxin system HicA family toxin [Nevskia sp.]|nr:type II toxin-antitoxin system HicA family toxin [Nevskia sp.]